MNAIFKPLSVSIYSIDGRKKLTIDVEWALNDVAKCLGMGGRTDVDYGMLFKGSEGFWMQGCLIDLDIAFINNGIIQEVVFMSNQDQNVNYSPNTDCEWALELPAGLCSQYGITVGDRIKVRQ